MRALTAHLLEASDFALALALAFACAFIIITLTSSSSERPFALVSKRFRLRDSLRSSFLT